MGQKIDGFWNFQIDNYHKKKVLFKKKNYVQNKLRTSYILFCII